MHQPHDSLSHFHPAEVQHYDSRIPALVPGYQALHHSSAALLKTLLPARSRVLVVGAGTGAELLALHALGMRPECTAVEPMPEMLALARAKCDAAGLRGICWHAGFVHELPPPASAQGAHDAALCHLVMHFIDTLDGKQRLLTDIAHRLKPGAPLLQSDLLASHAPWPDERAALIECAVSLGMPEQRRSLMRTRLQTDFFPLHAQQLAELAAASGFEAPRLFFRTLSFGGWLLRRLQGPGAPLPRP